MPKKTAFSDCLLALRAASYCRTPSNQPLTSGGQRCPSADKHRPQVAKRAVCFQCLPLVYELHLPPLAKASLANGESRMFRISFDEHLAGVTVRIEGRFAGHFAGEAKQSILCRTFPAELVVDLTEVTFADGAGEDALKWLSGVGAKFVAESSYALYLCERLRLPVSTDSANGNGKGSRKLNSPVSTTNSNRDQS